MMDGILATQQLPGALRRNDCETASFKIAPWSRNSSITLQLTDKFGLKRISYTIHSPAINVPSNTCTLIAIENDPYNSWGGLNIGGVSALVLDILIDYRSNIVGLQVKPTAAQPLPLLGRNASTAWGSGSSAGIMLARLTSVFDEHDTPTVVLKTVQFTQGNWRRMAMESPSSFSAAEGTHLAMLSNSNGTEAQLLYQSSNLVLHIATWNGLVWRTAPTSLTLTAFHPLAAMSSDNLKTIHLYSSGNDGKIYEYVSPNWTATALDIPSARGSALAVVAWGNPYSTTRLYVQLEDNTIQEFARRTPFLTWQVGENLGLAQPGTAIAAAVNSSGNVDVFFQRDLNGGYLVRWHLNTEWSFSMVDAQCHLPTGISAISINGLANFFVNVTPQSFAQGTPAGDNWSVSIVNK